MTTPTPTPARYSSTTSPTAGAAGCASTRQANCQNREGTKDPADEVALRHWLTGALATLTAKERAVVVMRYLFDQPEAAVAGDLGITVGTVKSTSSRALAKLRVRADDAVPGRSQSEVTGHDRPRHHGPAPGAARRRVTQATRST